MCVIVILLPSSMRATRWRLFVINTSMNWIPIQDSSTPLRSFQHKTNMHPYFQAWPFAFQHGGTLSCAISQRWNVNPQTNDSSTCRNVQPPRENVQDSHNNREGYPEYPENEYEERCYEEMPTNDSCAPMQYCNYGYKDNYYDMRNDMRNSYASDSMMNWCKK